MKIVIIGPGALGTLLAATFITKAKPEDSHDIWLLDYKPARAELLNKEGLALDRDGQLLRCEVNATTDPNKIGTADIIFLCVKYHDIAAGLEQAAKLSSPESIIITMQNGIGHLEQLKSGKTSSAVVLGVTAMGANIVSDGHVRHAGSGLTRIGFLRSASFARSLLLAKVCNLLNDCGLETAIVDDIMNYVWSKLLINVGINALTAINNCTNGELLQSEKTKSTLVAAVQEGATVARALDIDLPGDPVAMTLEVCQKTGQNISSMLQDVRSHRPTEIDSINGEIVAAGSRLSIPVTVNQGLVESIKEIEKKY